MPQVSSRRSPYQRVTPEGDDRGIARQRHRGAVWARLTPIFIDLLRPSDAERASTAGREDGRPWRPFTPERPCSTLRQAHPTVPNCKDRHNFATAVAVTSAWRRPWLFVRETQPARGPNRNSRLWPAEELSKGWRFLTTY